MEPLADPRNDRAVKEIEPPPAKPITDKLLFPEGSDGPPDWKCLKSHIFKEGRVTKEHCLEVVKRLSDLTSSEPNLLRLSAPVTVVGDIHGQYYDLVKLLEVGGDPEKTQYLFLGDYVDRGSFSIEVLLLLYALKLNFPKTVWLLRGNHECRQMTAFFNFRDECEYKYDLTVYYSFMESFDTLPVAAVIDNKFLCLHGGLSPELDIVRNVVVTLCTSSGVATAVSQLSQVGMINRFQEPPRAGLFCDLLWADPVDEEKMEHTLAQSSETFYPNDVRGCSFFFGYEAATKFLQKNHLLSIIRAHEAQLEGFKMHQTNTQSGFPTVITIFSAPNYCDCYNNKGAVLKFENNTLNIQQFNFSSHPYHLPNFMDVFTWSIPFVSEKGESLVHERHGERVAFSVTEMLYAILNPSVDDFEEEEASDVELPDEVTLFMKTAMLGAEETEAAAESAARGRVARAVEGTRVESKPAMTRERAEALRKKVQSVARLMRVFRTLREQNELIVQLKGVTPAHRIPPGALLKGEEGLKNELQKFMNAKQLDRPNERRPDLQ